MVKVNARDAHVCQIDHVCDAEGQNTYPKTRKQEFVHQLPRRDFVILRNGSVYPIFPRSEIARDLERSP